jgi:DNA-binding SARP family transcriptional activator
MRGLAAEGNAAEGLLVYEQLRRLLNAELGAAPSAATQALHRSLLGA